MLRRRFRPRSAQILCLSQIVLLLVFALKASGQSSNGISYVYDELGRLWSEPQK
jgi:hypothetical protein